MKDHWKPADPAIMARGKYREELPFWILRDGLVWVLVGK